MIRVLHFVPAFSIGGVESLLMSLYRNIDREQVQFDFLVETKEDLTAFDEIEKYGGKVYTLDKLNKKAPWKYLKDVKDFFYTYAKNYNVLHCHNMERGLAVLYYAKKYQINCRIFHAHTDSFVGVNYEKLIPFIVRLDIGLSTHLFACSKAAGDFQFSDSQRPYIIVKNAIDTKLYSFNPNKRVEIRKKMNFENTFVIGHTGRFAYAKNHARIIDIFKEVYSENVDARLLLVGDGPLKQEIELKVNNLGLSKVVVFTGSIDNIEDVLQSMDVFLLPSFFEGFCISLLEAQSTGLHCVTSDIIPHEVELTPLISQLSLDDSSINWRDEILKWKIYKRESQQSLIKKNGYDIKENSKWLMGFYLDT